MTKLKKTIASLAACALMTSVLALNASAVDNNKPFITFADGTEGYATLEHTSTTATATTSLTSMGGTASVSIVGKYYIKGTSKITSTSNGGGGTTGATASIYNGGGDWVSLESTHNASYGGTSGKTTKKWP